MADQCQRQGKLEALSTPASSARACVGVGWRRGGGGGLLGVVLIADDGAEAGAGAYANGCAASAGSQRVVQLPHKRSASSDRNRDWAHSGHRSEHAVQVRAYAHRAIESLEGVVVLRL